MKVNHLNLTAGAVETAEFSVKSSAFLVKNFTDNDIKVCLGGEMTEDYVIIPSKAFEVIENKSAPSASEIFIDKVTVEAMGAGIVEVRQV